MIKALYILGKYLDFEEETLFTEEEKLKNIKKVILINLKISKESTIFDEIKLEDFDRSKAKSYLYLTTPHKKFEVTPTSKLSLSKIEDNEHDIKKKSFKTY